MKLFFAILVTMLHAPAFAFEENLLDELDPRSPEIEEKLQEMDEAYLKMTGEMPFLKKDKENICYRNGCPVWGYASIKEQLMYLYVDGAIQYVWPISSGKRGYETPYMDQNPNGRIYDRYSSTAYPGGDYNGLGNMPYAVFIRGGYAVHGTLRSNWPMLGKPASKGCIRLHPDNAFVFNRLVRSLGVGLTWITVE